VRLEASLGSGLAVPRDAVLDSGTRQTVFVVRGNGFFEPRDVTTGHRTDDAIQIVAGLEEGEQVAVAANFLLDSESQLQSVLTSFAGGAAPAASAGRELAVSLRTIPPSSEAQLK
jgi:membrane fusion protein, copper/silver efflux system